MTIAESNSIVPANVSRIIREKGFSQKAIAIKASLSPQQLTDILRGRKLIRAVDIIALASAMQVSEGELFHSAYEGNRQKMEAISGQIKCRSLAEISQFTPIKTDRSDLISD